MFGKRFRADAAASPVIGVIMMVGTTVILGASVYTWTSGYADLPENAVKVLALASGGPPEGGAKTYVVAAVMPGVRYDHLDLTLDHKGLRHHKAGACADAPPPNAYVVCRDGAVLAANETALPGDTLTFRAQVDQTLRVVDAEARFIVLTMTVH